MAIRGIELKTYSGSNAGATIEPAIWNAKKSVWIISPWIGNEYAQQLTSLSHKGIEVRIITSNHDNNLESLQIFNASENPNLLLLVLNNDRTGSESNFIHSKIYLVDNKFGISGSANFTYSGLHSNVESLSIAETMEEVQRIEMDFMRLWMAYERKGLSPEALSSESSTSVRWALPLNENFSSFNKPNVLSTELVYHPYYFFEFSFRASAGNSPPILFQKHGFVVLDGVIRQIVKDDELNYEIDNYQTRDYVVKTDNKYRITIKPSSVHDFREARELALDYIIDANTEKYTQRSRYRSNYGGTYEKIFVPYRNIINFIKSGFVHVPLWYIDVRKPEQSKHQDIVFGSSGRKWAEFLYCGDCQRKVWMMEAVGCEICGKEVCNACVKKLGLIFGKKVCKECYIKNKR